MESPGEMKRARQRRQRLATLIEAVCVAPAVALALVGGAGWVAHLWMTCRVQGAADAALTAAAAEIEVAAREPRARAAAERFLTGGNRARVGAMRLSLVSNPDALSVLVIYDASDSPAFALRGLIPMPSPVIVRLSSRRLGG